jgi:hypothetical protein
MNGKGMKKDDGRPGSRDIVENFGVTADEPLHRKIIVNWAD